MAFSARPRTRWYLGVAIVGVMVFGAALTRLTSRTAALDPYRIVPVDIGTMVRSVVATGKIEPISKVEIKSKANGIIKVLRVDIDSVVNQDDVLVELDKEQLQAQLRGA